MRVKRTLTATSTNGFDNTTYRYQRDDDNFTILPSQRFFYICLTKVQTPTVNTCIHVRVQTRTVLVYIMYKYV